MARELYISEKTWRRWKAKAAIPADRLDDVARVLNLDIERPPARRVVLAEEASRLVEAESATAAALVVLDGRLEDIAATVAVLAKGQAEMLAALQGAAREERGQPRVRPRRRTAAE
jgi:hypothetical protein